jgi:hypothetical protein
MPPGNRITEADSHLSKEGSTGEGTQLGTHLTHRSLIGKFRKAAGWFGNVQTFSEELPGYTGGVRNADGYTQDEQDALNSR